MSMLDDFRGQGDRDRSLGEAANRWVTWQIVMSFIGLAIFDRSAPRAEAIGRCWSRGRFLEWLADS